MTSADLLRFVEAQASIYDQVRRELRDGMKRSHWMWFIFPQLKGLGRSQTAVHFGIDDLAQARRYLSDPLLGQRLRECTRLVLGHAGCSAHEIFGSPDDIKFRSCLTLFLESASDEFDVELFRAALDQFFGGEKDELTMQLIG